MIQITKITSKKPRILSKGFKLGTKGELVKTPGGQMIVGIAERLHLHGIEELGSELQKLKPANALTYGLSIHERAEVVTKQALAKTQARSNGRLPIIARTREHFSYPKGAGVLMFDYDPPEGQEPLSGEEFRHEIYSIAPAIEYAPHILTASASSHIYKDEKCLRGPKGWRMLVVVEQGTDIPRAGGDFVKRCWLKDQGYIGISKAGTLLERARVDAAVWQPERLDFCGGAWCKEPLEQRRPEAGIYTPDAKPLETAEAIKRLSLSEEEEVKDLIKAAKEDISSDAQKVRHDWVDVQVEKRLKEIPKENRKNANHQLREAYRKAVENMVLLGDFIVYPETGKKITIAEMLDNPDRWHGKRFADPLEPAYENDRRIAWANLHAAGRPYLWSHAHGGRRFQLHRALQTIQLNPGERVRLVKASLHLMKLNGSHFRRGGEVVLVSARGEVLARGKDGILYDLDGLAHWEKYDGRSESFVPCDCKLNIATGVLAAKGYWDLPDLTGVATAPVLDPKTGRLIEMDGFDKKTGLLLIMGDLTTWPGIPGKPNADQVKIALEILWKPFSEFPFDNPVSRGVMLSSLLTGMIRSLLPTAPGHAYDSPVAGSGKSLLGKCLAELSGETAAMLPNVKDNDEMRKRLLAVLRENKRVVIFDNVVGQLDSPALCAALTAETYGDRVLGVSETVEVPTRMLLIITGNNISLRGDLCRRVLMCRIDPGMETPWKRRFDMDPAGHCRNHRLEIVAAALTVLRAGLRQGPSLPDRTASFELWSDSVRRVVVWVGKNSFMEVDDPVKSIDASYDLDPETQKLGKLLCVWWEYFKDARLTVGEVIRAVESKKEKEAVDIYDVLDEIAGEHGKINSRRLGRWIERYRGRVAESRFFEQAGKRKRAIVWRVRQKG